LPFVYIFAFRWPSMRFWMDCGFAMDCK